MKMYEKCMLSLYLNNKYEYASNLLMPEWTVQDYAASLLT